MVSKAKKNPKRVKGGPMAVAPMEIAAAYGEIVVEPEQITQEVIPPAKPVGTEVPTVLFSFCGEENISHELATGEVIRPSKPDFLERLEFPLRTPTENVIQWRCKSLKPLAEKREVCPTETSLTANGM
jgi:hypothetical protein